VLSVSLPKLIHQERVYIMCCSDEQVHSLPGIATDLQISPAAAASHDHQCCGRCKQAATAERTKAATASVPGATLHSLPVGERRVNQ